MNDVFGGTLKLNTIAYEFKAAILHFLWSFYIGIYNLQTIPEDELIFLVIFWLSVLSYFIIHLARILIAVDESYRLSTNVSIDTKLWAAHEILAGRYYTPIPI